MMTRTMLKSRIHRARLTDTRLDYEGSITIDSDLLRAAEMLAGEQGGCSNSKRCCENWKQESC